jgi:hypothetical protein
MKLFIENPSSDVLEYASGALVIPAASKTEIAPSFWAGLTFCPYFRKDFKFKNIKVYDDFLEFSDDEMPELLNKMSQSRDPDGNPIFAPTFENGLGLNAVWKGYKYQANADAINFFDEEITTQLKVLGGWYELIVGTGNNKPALGDYLEFSVIDKDDVTGLFTYLGLTVGVDILQLGKFIRTEMINPHGGNKRETFQVKTPQLVIPGLYFRTAYVSTGPTYPVDFKIDLNYYEV